MCNDFDCQHDQCGICSYTDEDCEFEGCDMWGDCSQCSYEVQCQERENDTKGMIK